MLDEKTIKKELEKQVKNVNKIEKEAEKGNGNEQFAEVMQSIQGTLQRLAILKNPNVEELYNQYTEEINDTSELIFKDSSTEKEKIINGLEYMRITVNKESEKIDKLEDINTSGINAAVLGEGTEHSSLAYYRDLLNNEGITANIVETDYTDENGEKQKQNLVEVKTQDGLSLLINPYEYDGTLESIEKYNNGDYSKKSGLIGKITSFFNRNGLNNGKIEITQEELSSGSNGVNEKLIQKYNIREISQIAEIYQSNSADNQLKILGLVGNNLTPIQGKSELLRTVRMNDGKEIEVSKLLELFYQANGMEYQKEVGADKADVSFIFNENGQTYTISPSLIYQNYKGEDINTDNIFISENPEQVLRGLTYPEDSSKTIEECNDLMKDKMEYSFMNVRDFNIPNLQNDIQEQTMDVSQIKKQEEIKHYSIDDISYQLGIQDLIKSGKKEDLLKANSIIVAYINQNAYNYMDNNGEMVQAVQMSDRKAKWTSDVLELFYIQNGIEYKRDENNNLIFKIGDEEYMWQYNYNALLTDKALAEDLLSNQDLINLTKNEKVEHNSLDRMDNEKIKGVIDLSERIPTSKEETQEQLQELASVNSEIDSLPHENYRIESQVNIKNRFEESGKENYSKEYDEYMEKKQGKEEYYSKSDEEKIEEYKQKIKEVSEKISSTCKTDEEKILVTMEYVRLSGRYENISEYNGMMVGAYLSQDGMSYALAGEGVCASQAQYTRDLLNALGLEATVENCNADDNSNVAFADQSNHSITRVNLDGKSIVLDPTNYYGNTTTLAHEGKYSIYDITEQTNSIIEGMQKEGKTQEEINEAIGKLYEANDLKSSISAEIYPKQVLDYKMKTPFGIKTLRELHFSTLEPTNEELLNAREKAANILIPELGIDNISNELGIDKCTNDMEKQALILGYIENNLQTPESDKPEDIRSRVVNVGDTTLELNDVLELMYLQNGIDYDINGNHLIDVNLDDTEVSINTFDAYKHGLSNEEERNEILKKNDGSYLDISSLIESAVQKILKIQENNKSFSERYKVDGIEFTPHEETVNNNEREEQKEDSIEIE